MMFDRDLLKRLFRSFCDIYLRPVYHFGDTDIYEHIKLEDMKNNGCNPYMETEDDYKVKLGGFLESHVLPMGYTIHAELNRVYRGEGSGTMRPDLTIHTVTRPESGQWAWLNDDIRSRSLCCVIELKAANVRHPEYNFKTGKIEADIRKLGNNLSPLQVTKCLVILDEANGISHGRRDEMENWVKQYDPDILILSNNPALEVDLRAPELA